MNQMLKKIITLDVLKTLISSESMLQLCKTHPFFCFFHKPIFVGFSAFLFNP